jgi:hypothetical protein
MVADRLDRATIDSGLIGKKEFDCGDEMLIVRVYISNQQAKSIISALNSSRAFMARSVILELRRN